MNTTPPAFKQKTLVDMCAEFKSWGYTDIRSPYLIETLPTTRKIGKYRPDMTFKKGEVLFIVEVGTAESLALEESWNRWVAFSQKVKEEKCCFWILVPQGESADFIRKINDFRVDASVHEV